MHTPLNIVTLMMKAICSSETSVLTKPHGVTSQKTEFFIATAMKTSNLTMRYTVVVIACERCRTPGRRHARRNHGSQFSTHACRRAGVQSPWIFYGYLDSVVLLPEHYVYSLHAAVVHARHSLVGGNLSRWQPCVRSLMLRDVDNFTGIHHSSTSSSLRIARNIM
jgi:hypothetical protein